MAQTGDSGVYRGGMVGEVVINGNAVYHAAHFHAPFHVPELDQGRQALRGGHAGVTRGGKRGECVVAIVYTQQIPIKRALRFAVQRHQIVVVNLPAIIRAEAFHRGPAAALQHAIQRGFTAIADDQSIAGNSAHQMVELRFYRCEVGKDVGMVEFEIVEYRGARVVMHEFGTLVEKCGVVFIRFDDKEWRLGKSR